jgi:hypothetical protein
MFVWTLASRCENVISNDTQREGYLEGMWNNEY